MIRDKKNRTDLSKAIPLSGPMVVHIEVTNVCNFKCEFCASVDNPEFEKIPKGFMDPSLFKKIIDDLKAFEKPVKRMSFHILGEPLLHPDIAKMIKYAKEANVANEIMLFSNCAKLTPELSREIVQSGCDIIQASIEHVTSEGYKNVTRVNVDYDDLLNNLGYLYDFKNISRNDKPQIIAKILDVGLSDKEKEKFFEDFKSITDECHIESLIQTIDENVRDTTLGMGQKTTVDGFELKGKAVCTAPFYILGISVDGSVSPCVCDFARSVIIGNVHEETMVNIWNGEKANAIRKMQLEGNRYKHPFCGRCMAIKNQIDDIDETKEEILKRI